MSTAVNKKIVDFDAMIEVDATTTIYGFADFGCEDLNDNKWCLLKETITGDITIRQWSNGSKSKNVIFNQYATTNFKYLV